VADRLPLAPDTSTSARGSRAEVGEEVRVGVSVRVGPVEFKLYRLSSVVVLSVCQSVGLSVDNE